MRECVYVCVCCLMRFPKMDLILHSTNLSIRRVDMLFEQHEKKNQTEIRFHFNEPSFFLFRYSRIKLYHI